MMNALAEDMVRSGVGAVHEFLNLIRFPGEDVPAWDNFLNVEILVEQSFSDFGDADLLLLLTGEDGKKAAVLVEAKVSTDTDSWQTVDERWGRFLQSLEAGGGNPSNLFVQLHRKAKLIELLRAKRAPIPGEIFMTRGSLGKNRIVQKAVSKLEEHVLQGSVYFVALLPDDMDSLTHFFSAEFQSGRAKAVLQTWSPENWGFVSWHSVSELSSSYWERTKNALRWNDGQIFRSTSSARESVEAGQVYSFNGRPVFVVDAGKGWTCRFAFLDDSSADNFWFTETASLGEFKVAQALISPDEYPHLPQSGQTYEWSPKLASAELRASKASPDLAVGTKVVVLGQPKWLRTRVRLADDPEGAQSFLVFTHHLRRQAHRQSE